MISPLIPQHVTPLLTEIQTMSGQKNDTIEFSRNTQSWQCWHFCTTSNKNKLEVVTSGTSGIPGGYRFVSTYDLPGCKTILKFKIWSFSNLGGGVFWNSWIWTLWQFSFWGGGVFWNSWIWNLTIFMGGGGVFWNSWIWNLWQFSLGGGYSETLGFGISDNFHWGGGYSVLQNRGILRNFHQNFNHSSRPMHHR